MMGAESAVIRIMARLVLSLLLWGGGCGAVWAGNIAATKHNLSVTGPGSVKASSESQICIFCHTPHNASPATALWNRRTPSASYTPYGSTTEKSVMGQPKGASLTCLSCHDGTIAMGELLSRSQIVTMAGGKTTMPAGTSNLGTDLSDDHPVSITYNAALVSARNGQLANPASLPSKVRLDSSGQLQCTTCHDPHDNTNGKFLVMSNQGSALCQVCHLLPGWASSSHKTSSATWNGSGTNPWPHTSATTVAGNGCENCHRPHSAGGRKWLLNYAAEENNCNNCHNATVAAKNIKAELSKASIHPVGQTTGVHDAAEPAIIQSRHVECVDCHDPHAAKSGTGSLPGSLTSVRGVTVSGSEISASTAEYQICLRCHGDSSGKKAPKITRQIVQGNLRLEFNTANPSYHPVAGVGKSTSVPDLISPLTTSSIIKCSDCHNNNTGPGAGGTGPKGPHASTYSPLLERRYDTADYTTESAAAYALCYKCHDRNTLLNANNNIAKKVHKLHVVSKKTPCSACHDPHGISSSQGNTTNNSRLINFDTTIVKANNSGVLKWSRTGTGKGSCYMKCHGDNHSPESY